MKKSKNKRYSSVLERQRYEKLQEKLANDQLKLREMQEMKEKEKQLEKAAELEREQKQKYLEYMNNAYKTSLEYKHVKEREKREIELEEEKERLKRIQKDMKEEQRRNNIKKTTFVQEAQEVANHKRMLKDLEAQRKQDEKQEYQKLAKENYDREVERENNYKKFFKDFDNNMGERVKNHMEHVTNQEINKQARMDRIEDQNQKQYNDWLTQKEQREREGRSRRFKEMNEENKKVFDKLDREKTHKKEMYQKMVEERRKEEDDYKDYQKKLAEQEEESRRLYREALEFQKGYQEYNKSHLGQMTQMEKKLNKPDLKLYKQKQVGYQGMVPGIHNLNSVGSKPLLRIAKDEVYDTAVHSPSFAKNDLSKSYKDFKNSMKPLENHTNPASPARNDRYDPITNPIPFLNQNPYISKQKTVMGGAGAGSAMTHRHSRRSLLSSTAEKNILI